MATRLLSARLVLRPPRPADVPELRRVMRRNQEHLRPWIPSAAPGTDPTSLTELAKMVLRARRDWRNGTAFMFLVWKPGERPAPATIIGRIGLTQVVRGPLQSAYLGYWIDVDHQRKGITTEAVDTVLAFAFDAVGLHRVGAGIMPRNTASVRVVEKVGMRMEGLSERLLEIAGRWEDHMQFAITSEEWEARVAVPVSVT